MVKRFTKSMLAVAGLEVSQNRLRRYNKLGFFGIPVDEWRPDGEGYYLSFLDVRVTSLDSPLITGYANARKLKLSGNASFTYDSSDRLVLSIQGIKFFINFTDELFVINEVFVSNEYNFLTKEDFVVIDVGLNIGATSLFFARKPNVRSVYSYELFEGTYEAAKKNFTLNEVSTKIVAHNVGLGASDKKISIRYSPTVKATMGLSGVPESAGVVDVVMTNVEVVDASKEFQKIRQQEPGYRIFCKMDCEGAEFEIIECLFNNNALSLVDCYVIEWHKEDTGILESRFLESGFNVIKPITNIDTGLIYAFKAR